jgi:hypothetical protein
VACTKHRHRHGDAPGPRGPRRITSTRARGWHPWYTLMVARDDRHRRRDGGRAAAAAIIRVRLDSFGRVRGGVSYPHAASRVATLLRRRMSEPELRAPGPTRSESRCRLSALQGPGPGTRSLPVLRLGVSPGWRLGPRSGTGARFKLPLSAVPVNSVTQICDRHRVTRPVGHMTGSISSCRAKEQHACGQHARFAAPADTVA